MQIHWLYMSQYREGLVQFLVITGLLVVLSTQVYAKSNISLGHFIVDTPSEDYQFTSLSMRYQYARFKAKLMVPFIQHEGFSNGLGNPVLKFSNDWHFDGKEKQLTLIYKQKLALADNNTTTAVSDSALGLEYSHVFSWGIPFFEMGHWWRESVSYNRKNSIYGTLGFIKPIKRYVLAVIVDNKPTALGDEDSMASIFVRKKITSTQAVSFLYGTGLNNSSPNHTLGLQINQSF